MLCRALLLKGTSLAVLRKSIYRLFLRRRNLYRGNYFNITNRF